MQRLKLSISPCPNDTFMFDAIINGRIDLDGFAFDVAYHDIEELNRALEAGAPDISKMSCALLPEITSEYRLLDSGAALGRGNGPLLVRRWGERAPLRRIAVPGLHTTANALVARLFPEIGERVPLLFSEIAAAVERGDFDAGVLIPGKTGQVAAALTKPASQVVALDIHDHKVKLIQKNMVRLGLATHVSARQGDARQLAFLADGSLDAAVVDAPCSGLGLLRRKPEIRYQKTFRDSQRLHEIQLAILAAVAPKIKKGGIITYSTCTILKEENDQTVAAFLAAHPNFALEKTQTARALKADRAAKTLTILPSDYGSDGFFIATLKRVE